MARTSIDGASALLALGGADLGATDFRPLDFAQITTFAEATGDHQWIHVDKARIARESPFGAPIAHGYLTLALVAGQFFELLELSGFRMVINYGCNKVRFPSPLKEGASWRLAMKLGTVTQQGDWLEAQFIATIEIQGSAKPACVAECIYRFLPA
ncbi:MAG: MaoC family dehydratase [Deltaproteobacteria bacterium]|nr:MaoC family dehydratase [Deltaproteobacteria bacterium]